MTPYMFKYETIGPQLTEALERGLDFDGLTILVD